MPLDFREDGLLGQQPMECAGEVFLVTLGLSLLRLVRSFTLRTPS
jgi:hypothetical protein